MTKKPQLPPHAEPKERLRKVMIRFGDNDFRTVMRVFGDLLINQYNPSQMGDGWLTKANVVRWFNDIAFTLYQMVQIKHSWITSKNDSSHLKAYLTITEARVYLDEEVDKELETAHLWGNSESIVVEFGADRRQWPQPRAYLV